MKNPGFEPDHVRKWIATPIGAQGVDDNPALQRTADVLLDAMTAAGADNLDVAMTVLIKVQAMIAAQMMRGASAQEREAILTRLGPGVQDEVVKFWRAYSRDVREAH